MQQIYDGKRNYGGNSLLPVLEKMYWGVITYKIRKWLVHHKKQTFFQTGFTKGRRTVDNIFMIETCVDEFIHQ
jgi:hypothetical protein